MPIEIRHHPSAAALGAAVAEHLAGIAAGAAGAGRRCLVGWPAGRTPQVVVVGLVALARAGRLDLRHVGLVLMDEYVEGGPGSWSAVPAELPYSCRGFVAREVVAALNAALPFGRRLHPDAVWSPDPGHPAAYDERIAAAGGLDIFVVASGSSDGHVAFRPPGSDRHGGTSIVRLAESTRRDNLRTFPDFGRLEDVPTHGVSVGLGTIMAARELTVVVHGRDKRRAAVALLDGTGFRPDWPATITLEHPTARLWVDAEAAGPDRDR